MLVGSFEQAYNLGTIYGDIVEEFKLLNKSKMLLKYVESNILINIPKVHSSYRKGLEDNMIQLNYNIIKANINTGSIRSKYQKEILVNIAMIDLYLDLLLDIKIISRKKFMVIIRMLNEIRKMANGWILSEKNK